MNRILLWAAVAALATSSALPAATSLPYGREPGQVAFLNAATAEGYVGTPLPLGPQAFRVAGADTWIADSLQGRILRVDATGKVTATLQVVPKGTPAMLGDLAVVRDGKGNTTGLWTVNRHTQEVTLISPEGKVVRTVTHTPGFLDVLRLEAGPSGNLYVGDQGHGKVFVFGPDGKPVRDLPWTGGGFCLDAAERLHLLTWDQSAGKGSLASFDPAGKPLGEKPLQMALPGQPQVWAVTPAGEVVVTFAKEGLPPGTRQLARFKLTGEVVAAQEIPVPDGMNRFLDLAGDGSLWLGQADFDAAPQGSFSVVPLVFTAGNPQG
ncbi:MAG: hypothetical protein GX442_11235 [Candidatus Riflebacteria bacterium]|nr:hypothetical protein [Candidatus Riflebacteria bacterium]